MSTHIPEGQALIEGRGREAAIRALAAAEAAGFGPEVVRTVGAGYLVPKKVAKAYAEQLDADVEGIIAAAADQAASSEQAESTESTESTEVGESSSEESGETSETEEQPETTEEAGEEPATEDAAAAEETSAETETKAPAKSARGRKSKS